MIKSPKHGRIISESKLLRSGSPSIYQLRAKEETTGSIRRITLGPNSPRGTNKTILLVGETGTGKSTLVNALVNYAVGVAWEDDVWFQIVDDEKGHQSESQTSEVVQYQIFGFEGQPLPFSLTIIDTPGYGDTGGVQRDDIIRESLLDLFRSDDGVHEISAVGLVLKASENRLSDRLRYILDSALSLFGKDLEENIVVLVTHSDGLTPKNALNALDAANVKSARNHKNQPVHFLFNNCQMSQNKKKYRDGYKFAWDLSGDNLRRFMDFLQRAEPQTTMTTKRILKKRIRLNACIQNLEMEVRQIEYKQKEIQWTRSGINTQRMSQFFALVTQMSNVEYLREEMHQHQRHRDQYLEEAFKHVVTLGQIALNPRSLSTLVHLDFMIEQMEEKGDSKKVRKLKEMKLIVDEDSGIRGGLMYGFK